MSLSSYMLSEQLTSLLLQNGIPLEAVRGMGLESSVRSLLSGVMDGDTFRATIEASVESLHLGGDPLSGVNWEVLMEVWTGYQSNADDERMVVKGDGPEKGYGHHEHVPPERQEPEIVETLPEDDCDQQWVNGGFCGHAPTHPPVIGEVTAKNCLYRPNYFDGRYLDARIFQVQHQYSAQRDRLIAMAHQAGIAWGLGLDVAQHDKLTGRGRHPRFSGDAAVRLEPGLAFDPLGRPIANGTDFPFTFRELVHDYRQAPRRVLISEAAFSPCVCTERDPEQKADGPVAGAYLLVIRPVECGEGGAQVYGSVCGHNAAHCEPDGYRGGFALSLVRYPCSMQRAPKDAWALRGLFAAHYFDVYQACGGDRWKTVVGLDGGFAEASRLPAGDLALPLAMAYVGVDASVHFLDPWIARRQIEQTNAAAWASQRFGRPTDSAITARRHQFQGMLERSLEAAPMSPRGAPNLYERGFRHIPPAGFLPVDDPPDITEIEARALDPSTCVGAAYQAWRSYRGKKGGLQATEALERARMYFAGTNVLTIPFVALHDHDILEDHADAAPKDPIVLRRRNRADRSVAVRAALKVTVKRIYRWWRGHCCQPNKLQVRQVLQIEAVLAAIVRGMEQGDLDLNALICRELEPVRLTVPMAPASRIHPEVANLCWDEPEGHCGPLEFVSYSRQRLVWFQPIVCLIEAILGSLECMPAIVKSEDHTVEFAMRYSRSVAAERAAEPVELGAEYLAESGAVLLDSFKPARSRDLSRTYLSTSVLKERFSLERIPGLRCFAETWLSATFSVVVEDTLVVQWPELAQPRTWELWDHAVALTNEGAKEGEEYVYDDAIDMMLEEYAGFAPIKYASITLEDGGVEDLVRRLKSRAELRGEEEDLHGGLGTNVGAEMLYPQAFDLWRSPKTRGLYQVIRSELGCLPVYCLLHRHLHDGCCSSVVETAFAGLCIDLILSGTEEEAVAKLGRCTWGKARLELETMLRLLLVDLDGLAYSGRFGGLDWGRAWSRAMQIYRAHRVWETVTVDRGELERLVADARARGEERLEECLKTAGNEHDTRRKVVKTRIEAECEEEVEEETEQRREAFETIYLAKAVEAFDTAFEAEFEARRMAYTDELDRKRIAELDGIRATYSLRAANSVRLELEAHNAATKDLLEAIQVRHEQTRTRRVAELVEANATAADVEWSGEKARLDREHADARAAIEAHFDERLVAVGPPAEAIEAMNALYAEKRVAADAELAAAAATERVAIIADASTDLNADLETARTRSESLLEARVGEIDEDHDALAKTAAEAALQRIDGQIAARDDQKREAAMVAVNAEVVAAGTVYDKETARMRGEILDERTSLVATYAPAMLQDRITAFRADNAATFRDRVASERDADADAAALKDLVAERSKPLADERKKLVANAKRSATIGLNAEKKTIEADFEAIKRDRLFADTAEFRETIETSVPELRLEYASHPERFLADVKAGRTPLHMELRPLIDAAMSAAADAVDAELVAAVGVATVAANKTRDLAIREIEGEFDPQIAAEAAAAAEDFEIARDLEIDGAAESRLTVAVSGLSTAFESERTAALAANDARTAELESERDVAARTASLASRREELVVRMEADLAAEIVGHATEDAAARNDAVNAAVAVIEQGRKAGIAKAGAESAATLVETGAALRETSETDRDRALVQAAARTVAERAVAHAELDRERLAAVAALAEDTEAISAIEAERAESLSTADSEHATLEAGAETALRKRFAETLVLDRDAVLLEFWTAENDEIVESTGTRKEELDAALEALNVASIAEAETAIAERDPILLAENSDLVDARFSDPAVAMEIGRSELIEELTATHDNETAIVVTEIEDRWKVRLRKEHEDLTRERETSEEECVNRIETEISIEIRKIHEEWEKVTIEVHEEDCVWAQCGSLVSPKEILHGSLHVLSALHGVPEEGAPIEVDLEPNDDPAVIREVSATIGALRGIRKALGRQGFERFVGAFHPGLLEA